MAKKPSFAQQQVAAIAARLGVDVESIRKEASIPATAPRPTGEPIKLTGGTAKQMTADPEQAKLDRQRAPKGGFGQKREPGLADKMAAEVATKWAKSTPFDGMGEANTGMRVALYRTNPPSGMVSDWYRVKDAQGKSIASGFESEEAARAHMQELAKKQGFEPKLVAAHSLKQPDGKHVDPAAAAAEEFKARKAALRAEMAAEQKAHYERKHPIKKVEYYSEEHQGERKRVPKGNPRGGQYTK